MDITTILSIVDHTLLSPTAVFNDVKTVCNDAIKYNATSVCIPPSFVKEARRYVGNRIKICTVVGFPNGYSTTESKIFETMDAIRNGASEIDMVINIGWLKSKQYDLILDEINKIKGVCGRKTLKVIIETCLLTDEEKIKMCEIISKSNADFIKTSTGFGKKGAVIKDIVLFSKHIFNNKKIKAAGGIKSLADAEKFIEAGADRLGTSRVIAEIKTMS